MAMPSSSSSVRRSPRTLPRQLPRELEPDDIEPASLFDVDEEGEAALAEAEEADRRRLDEVESLAAGFELSQTSSVYKEKEKEKDNKIQMHESTIMLLEQTIDEKAEENNKLNQEKFALKMALEARCARHAHL